MAQLTLVRDHGPKGAYVAAGFVRNRVWDSMYRPVPPADVSDVDVVYFCENNASKARDSQYEAKLREKAPAIKWQVRNQARMHTYSGHQAYCSLEHGLTHWPETATAVGVRLIGDDKLEFVAPFGLEDLANHILRITPLVQAHAPAVFAQRIEEKCWRQRWPKMKVIGQ